MGYGGVRSFVRADTTVPLFGVSCLDGMGWDGIRSISRYLACQGATSAEGGDRERGKVLHAGWNNDRCY